MTAMTTSRSGAGPARGREPGASDHRIRSEDSASVVELVEFAGTLLADAPRLRPAEVVDYTVARCALGAVWSAAVDELLVQDPLDVPAHPPVAVVELLRAVKELDERILIEQVRERDRALHRVREALSALRDATSTAALIDLSSVTTCLLGFDRAIVSRIEDSLWIPESCHVDKDSRWADEILEAGRSYPQLLESGLIETEMVRRKVPITVNDVQDRPGVHRPLAEISMSQSYAAAPIMVHGAVTGFVHADRYHQHRNVDTTDRELLSMFADGLGQALSRTMVLDRLDALRSEIDAVTSAAAGLRDGGGGWRVERHTDTGLLASRPAGGFEVLLRSAACSLTRREVEVVALMAEGDTNARIARRLVISEGTVKSHVKHILRKLGVANRAEAVAHWLRMDGDRRGA